MKSASALTDAALCALLILLSVLPPAALAADAEETSASAAAAPQSETRRVPAAGLRPLPPPPPHAQRPQPKGFDSVDERRRAPQGFAQNAPENTVASLKKAAEDGDFAVISGVISAALGEGRYTLTDAEGESIEVRQSEKTLPKDLELKVGQRYQVWAQADKGFFSLSLDLLIVNEH